MAKVTAQFIDHALLGAELREQFETEYVANEHVRKMHIGVHLRLFPRGSELISQDLPQSGVRFGRRDAKEEGEVLADLGLVVRAYQLPVFANGVIHKECAVIGLLADGVADRLGLVSQFGQSVNAGRGVQRTA